MYLKSAFLFHHVLIFLEFDNLMMRDKQACPVTACNSEGNRSRVTHADPPFPGKSAAPYLAGSQFGSLVSVLSEPNVNMKPLFKPSLSYPYVERYGAGRCGQKGPHFNLDPGVVPDCKLCRIAPCRGNCAEAAATVQPETQLLNSIAGHSFPGKSAVATPKKLKFSWF